MRALLYEEFYHQRFRYLLVILVLWVAVPRLANFSSQPFELDRFITWVIILALTYSGGWSQHFFYYQAMPISKLNIVRTAFIKELIYTLIFTFTFVRIIGITHIAAYHYELRAIFSIMLFARSRLAYYHATFKKVTTLDIFAFSLQVIAYSLLLLISMKLSIALLLGSLVKFIYFYHKANQQIYYNEYQYSA